MSDFEKPKRDSTTEKLLNQFNQLDGPKGTTQAYRDNFDRIFNPPDTDCWEDELKSLGISAALELPPGKRAEVLAGYTPCGVCSACQRAG